MRILLVDDEESLLSLLQQYLTRSGHETVLASNVAEALAVAGDAFDAAVVDLSLPDGSGEEVAVALLNRPHGDGAPAPKVVMASGYAYDPPQSLAGKVIVLQKPFLPRNLLNVLG